MIPHLRAFIVALVSFFVSVVHGQGDYASPGVQGATGECLYCQVGVINVMVDDDVAISSYRCITDKIQEGDGESEMAYLINLPTAFANAHKVALDSGVSSICIIGGSAIRTEFGKLDFVVIPLNTDIYFVASRSNRVRQLVQTGNRTMLIVRVTAPNSTQSNSPERLANATFGIGGQRNSMAAQYSSCSAGQLSFVAATGFPNKITNGVIELPIQSTINNISIFSLENSMKVGVRISLGVTDLGSAFSHIVFCLPFGTTFKGGNWIAYSYGSGSYSYYNNAFCSSLSAKMHEIGHNLGLQHSNENGTEYADGSCMMGYSYESTESPVMCFNGHKNYVLGWYADKQIILEPTKGVTWSGKLVGFVDYTKASTSRNEYVLVVFGTLFIQYNLAEGFNSQVQEKANLVTIVTAPTSTSQSFMLLSLSAKQFVVVDSYRIEACTVVAANSTAPKHMTLSIRLSNQSSTCPGATLVTMTPTAQPTARPTNKPTFKPTEKPTTLPTTNPTATIPIPTALPSTVNTVPSKTLTSNPSQSEVPSKIPTTTPTALPTDTPTFIPTISPTVMPTAMPTRIPTVSVSSIIVTAKPTLTTKPVTFKPTRKPTKTPKPKPTTLKPSPHSTTQKPTTSSPIQA